MWALFRLSTLATAAILLPCASVGAQETPSPSPPMGLVVEAGRPLRVALNERVKVTRIGQPIIGALIDPLYAFDRIVVPAGTVVRGHVEALQPESRLTRIQALASGNFSPSHRVVVRFDTLALADGRVLPIQSRVIDATEHITLSVAASSSDARSDEDSGRESVAHRARDRVEEEKQAAAAKARSVLAAIKSPRKKERIEATLVDRLPYHPQYLAKGSVYVVELLAALDFGSVPPPALAPPGSRPAAATILNARLVTPLNSAKTPRGSSMEAIITEPVFSEDHQLILPEGSRLVGEVTFATAARRFHRDGQLRFLVESIQVPQDAATQMLASLASVQVPDGNAVKVDEEGGARASESKRRFIAPALAVMALRASTHREPRRMDNDADDSIPRPAGSPGSRGVGGFFGWGLTGAIVSQFSRPVGLTLASIGVGRTLYQAVFAKGRDVTFPVDTMIQVQLAPGPASRP
jgi:hypothetical protein